MKIKTILLYLSLLITTPVLADCPADKPARWIDNTCYSCEEIKPIVEKHIQQQEKSINLTQMDAFFKLMETAAQISAVCPDEEKLKRQQLEEEKQKEMSPINGKCPPERPLKDNKGLCRACDDPYPFSMDFADLPQCDTICSAENQNTPRYRVNQNCLPKKCPDDKPLMDTLGECFACDDTSHRANVIDGCLKCSNRYVDGGFLSNNLSGVFCPLKTDFLYNEEKNTRFLTLMQKKCPDDKPILNEKGQCIPCLYHHDVMALRGCDKCPNRKIIIIDNILSFTYLYVCALKED